MQRAGISRVHADALIRQLNEFGEAYFQLSEIAHISPGACRQIAPRIENGSIDFDSEKIPLIPQNAAKIRTGIQRLRSHIRQARIELNAV